MWPRTIPGKHTLVLTSLTICLILSSVASAFASIYIHKSPAMFRWDPASGDVHHYNVYLKTNGGPPSAYASVPSNSCSISMEDGNSYVVQVEAENSHGLIGPLSNPSDEVVIFLKGTATDTDGDGMPDAWEISHGLNPYDPSDASADPDMDGLTNYQEYVYGMDPHNSDTDHDGVPDGEEVAKGQNPTVPNNNMPVANAGPDQVLNPTVVTLDGSGSMDPNGYPLTYSWSQTQGGHVRLSDPAAVKPTFLAKKYGDYVFQLLVSNGRVRSASDQVTVHINNVRPTADAGKLQTVNAGFQTILDGSNSGDPNGDPLTYSWVQILGHPVSLQNPQSVKTSFTPTYSGVYGFQLIVSDGQLQSPPTEVQVVVNAENHVPSADAGKNQTVHIKQRITLDGSGSTDPDGDPLRFLWSQVDGPEQVVLEGSTEVQASFQPSKVGVYRFELLVDDGKDTSPAAYVTVTVEDKNRQPVAVVAAVNPVKVGEWVSLDGSQSYDPDGDPLAYQWTQTAGALASLKNAAEAVTGFYAVTEGVLQFQLAVHDGELPSAPVQVDVTVYAPNEVAAANAGNDSGGGCSLIQEKILQKDVRATDLLFVATLFLPGLITLYCHKKRVRKVVSGNSVTRN